MTSRTRLLLVYLARAPLYPGFLSGGERHFIEVFNRAAEAGVDVEVLTCPTGRRLLEMNKLKARVHVISVPGEDFLDRTKAGLALVYLMRILLFLPRFFFLPKDFQVICTSSHYISDIFPAVLMSWRCKAKMSVYLHHLEAPFRERVKYHPAVASFLSSVNLWLCLFFSKHFASLVFVDRLGQERLKEMGFSPQVLQRYANAVDIPYINSVPAEGHHEACFLGRIAPLKGIFDLVDIWAPVCKEYPNALLAVVGSESKEYTDRLLQDVAAHGMEKNIILFGSVSEERKYGLLKGSRVFIAPSYEEGWGITLCEAMACGLPVVAYDLPAYTVYGDTAIRKVKVGDKLALSQRLLELFQNESLRKDMSEKAKLVAGQFDWNVVAADELEAMVRTVS